VNGQRSEDARLCEFIALLDAVSTAYAEQGESLGLSKECAGVAAAVLRHFANRGRELYLQPLPALPRLRLVVDNTQKSRPRDGSRRGAVKRLRQPHQPEKV
jgi:hypothetical protein